MATMYALNKRQQYKEWGKGNNINITYISIFVLSFLPNYLFQKNMVIKHRVSGYENFLEFFNSLDTKNKLIHVYFTGAKDSTGTSWCPDCNVAWPVVEKELSKLSDDSLFVVVEVGDRETWKDPNCPFRKDPKTRLMVIPTLKRWNEPQKLEGEQCEKPELVSMLFTHSEDD